MSNRALVGIEEEVYKILYDQCHRIIGKDRHHARSHDEFESMVVMCSLNGCLNKLSDMFPEPGDAVKCLKGMVNSGWITETVDRYGYPAFVPTTHMEIEHIEVKRTHIPGRP